MFPVFLLLHFLVCFLSKFSVGFILFASSWAFSGRSWWLSFRAQLLLLVNFQWTPPGVSFRTPPKTPHFVFWSLSVTVKILYLNKNYSSESHPVKYYLSNLVLNILKYQQ
jgi:hypothetical protein